MLSKEFMGYVVYSNGRIENMKGDEKKSYKRSDGYSMVTLYQDGNYKTFLIHRLVAMLFIPNPGNFNDVHHIDGNKNNNNYSNLEWVSRRGNMIAHSVASGRCIQVELKEPSGKITKYHSINEAARRNNVNPATLHRLVKLNRTDEFGRTWSIINGN